MDRSRSPYGRSRLAPPPPPLGMNFPQPPFPPSAGTAPAVAVTQSKSAPHSMPVGMPVPRMQGMYGSQELPGFLRPPASTVIPPGPPGVVPPPTFAGYRPSLQPPPLPPQQLSGAQQITSDLLSALSSPDFSTLGGTTPSSKINLSPLIGLGSSDPNGSFLHPGRPSMVGKAGAFSVPPPNLPPFPGTIPGMTSSGLPPAGQFPGPIGGGQSGPAPTYHQAKSASQVVPPASHIAPPVQVAPPASHVAAPASTGPAPVTQAAGLNLAGLDPSQLNRTNSSTSTGATVHAPSHVGAPPPPPPSTPPPPPPDFPGRPRAHVPPPVHPQRPLQPPQPPQPQQPLPQQPPPPHHPQQPPPPQPKQAQTPGGPGPRPQPQAQVPPPSPAEDDAPVEPIKRRRRAGEVEYEIPEAMKLQIELRDAFAGPHFQERLKILQRKYPERKTKGHQDGSRFFEAFETLTLTVHSKVLPEWGLTPDWDGVREMMSRMAEALEHPKVKRLQEEINVLMGLPRNANFAPPAKSEEMFVYRPSRDAPVPGPCRALLQDEDGDEAHEFFVEDQQGELKQRGPTALDEECWYQVVHTPAVVIREQPDEQSKMVGRKKVGKRIRIQKILDGKWLQLHRSELAKLGVQEAWVLSDGAEVGHEGQQLLTRVK